LLRNTSRQKHNLYEPLQQAIITFDTRPSRDRFFIGREEILTRLRQNFNTGERVQALNGLGGIGKTQTAVEYAYGYRQDYKAVWWARANTHETLVTDYAAIAELINLPEKNEQDQHKAVDAVNRWLESNSGWLLILDNADEIEIAEEFIPPGKTGDILLTTRARTIGRLGESNEFKKMYPEEGALFLLRRVTKAERSEASESAAEALSSLLDGLPLALDQAAAFIDEIPSTFEEYQFLYQAERKELLKRGSHLTTDKDHESVTVTFSIAFKKVADDSLAAADLLRVCAFLEADSIPEEIFSKSAKHLGEALGSTSERPLALINAIGAATRFSLLRRNPEARTLSIHRLVQAVLTDEMEPDTRQMWAERVVRSMSEVFPTVEYPNWPSCNRLISHAQPLASLIDGYSFDFLEAAIVMNRAGLYFDARAQYEEAEPFYQRSLNIFRYTFGPESPHIAVTINNLADLYRRQGRHDEAIQFNQRALEIRENALGHDHSDTAQSLNNLASTYHSQGKYEGAESLYRQALDMYEKSLGAEHPNTAGVLNNLGELYRMLGKHDEAAQFHQRALEIREKALPPEHPDIAMSLNNLALSYYSQGKHDEAERLFQRALEIKEKALGPGHPTIALSLNNLAELYIEQGKYAEAEPLLRRAIIICRKMLGPKHPNTLMVQESYASLVLSRPWQIVRRWFGR
jgi:tetratricopeptide (TPR) repeat protein